MLKDTLVLIPARFSSTRFPAKLLAEVEGQSIIKRVLLNMLKSDFDCAVVTDHQMIEDHLSDFSQYVVRVDDDVPSGSERIGLAYDRYFKNRNFNYIVNVQGDEPLLMATEVKRLVEFMRSSTYDICTMVKKRERQDQDFLNPNIVKAVYFPSNGKCAYFSRASVPFERDQKGVLPWYQHIGVYAYRTEALQQFLKAPLSVYEDGEKLEQLRAIEIGLQFGAIETKAQLVGIDTPEDLKKFEEVIRDSKK